MEHPITPPPELISQWFDESPYRDSGKHVAIQAARWGADQELEACCALLEIQCEGGRTFYSDAGEWLCAARRPKPPNLKEKALSLLPDRPGGIAMKHTLHPDDIELIRRALESIPDPQD